ncbi:MAG: hypothetical protein ACUVQ5_00095 [Candidatus Methanomethylicaceae archaeon]
MVRKNFAPLIAISIAYLCAVPTSISGYVTYFSGDDAILSLGDGTPDVEGVLCNLTYSSLWEDFERPPYTTLDQWASYNGWSFLGNCPCWSGMLWCGVNADGHLQWHNWFHDVSGSVYEVKIWKDLTMVNEYFELYVPISSSRPSGGGVAGSPDLHIFIELYDKKGAKIFSSEIVYNNPIRRIAASIYGENKVADNLYLNGLNIKLWQNSTGAYFSYDNGTSVMMSGMFYTSPTRVQLRFYIWEYNPTQPFSDYEYWVNIDKVALRSLSHEGVIFSGLPAGNWSLIDAEGKPVTQTNSTVHGASLYFEYRPRISDEFEDGLTGEWEKMNLATMEESGGYLITTANVDTWGTWAGARRAIRSVCGDFSIEAKLSYVGQSSDLAELYLAVLDSTGSVVAYAGVCDGWAGNNPQWACGVNQGSSWATGSNTLPGSGSLVIQIQRTGDTWTFKSSDSYGGVWSTKGSTASINYILLTNTRYHNYNGKTAKWDYVKTDIPGTTKPFDGVLVGLFDRTFVKGGTFFANSTLTYYEKGNYFTVAQTSNQGCFVIKGVPINDIVRIYQGEVLKKTIVSTGSDISVAQAEVPQPFLGSIEVVSRPYLRPAATYFGTLDWNEMLVYSEGALTKETTGALPESVSEGSEGQTTEGWIFSYNLISGGQTPTFSSSSGYVRFDEPHLSYYFPGAPWSYAPVMEAWYYFKYDLNQIVRNLTISVSADGYFNYHAAADMLLEGWGEIIIYVVSGSSWTQVARSAKSTTPLLTTTVSNLYSTSFTSVDMVVVAFHTYARAREGYALYTDPQWGRVDYLRINYSKIPDGYPGINVTGIKPGWRLRFGYSDYWADVNGCAIIPVNASSWPSMSMVEIYMPTFSQSDLFIPGYQYYLFVNRSFLPRVDTLYYEVSTDIFSYRVEFCLLSMSKIPTKTGQVYEMIFKYTVYEDGKPFDRRPKSLSIDGVPVVIGGRPGSFTTAFTTLNYSDEVRILCMDSSGVLLTGKIKFS